MTKVLLFSLAISLSSATGCKKQQRTEETAPSVAKGVEAPVKPIEKLRGASVVRDELKKKEYARAVEGVLGLRAFAVNDEQWMEYRELSSEVAQALVAAAKTDPNAAKALAAYNVAMYGR